MAISILDVLDRFGQIDQDALAQCFSYRYVLEPHRGYGSTAQRILRAIGEGSHWSVIAQDVHGGDGSMGNGGAMRAGPVGAYFAPDLGIVAEQARLSAQVTHAHPEGQAGAIAVAVAAAQASGVAIESASASRSQLIEAAIDYTPDGPTREGLVRASRLDADTPVREAARILGNGSGVISEDTVPFALWSAARHLVDFQEAMWAAASAWGDMDTTCAITGSIVVLATGLEGIPESWRRSREGLDLSRPGAESTND
jgi:ADP-ribosylglycohydrolase